MDIKELSKKVDIAKEKYNAILRVLELYGNERIIELHEIKDIINNELINYFNEYYDNLTCLNELIVEKIKKGENK